jgi:hypothetical protein
VAPASTIYSFPIFKSEPAGNGFLITGRATDGSVDSDRQVVDPRWAFPALKSWLSTGGNVRQSHDPTNPIGVGVDCWQDGSGATWVKSRIVRKSAIKLIKSRVLTAYSIGIGWPEIRKGAGDPPGGTITGGRIIELTVCDRPSNSSCGIEIVKSVGGVAVYVGKSFELDAKHWVVLDGCRCAACMKSRRKCGCPRCAGAVAAVRQSRDAARQHEAAFKAVLAREASPYNPDPMARESARALLLKAL